MSTTAPLTPADADLQDFPFMPLHVARLRDSDLAAEENPEACWYAVLLWAASWHQLPAGSLPDNDTVLMRLVGLGRDQRTWKRYKAAAMRGFVLCTDSRWYHPVVAEQVCSAWGKKLEQRWRTECARIKKHNQRNDTSIDAPSLESFIANGCTPVPLDKPPLSHGNHVVVPRDNGSKGQGEGQGQRDSNLEDEDAGAKSNVELGGPGTSLSAQLARIAEEAGIANLDPSRRRWADELGRLKTWNGKGYDLEQHILPAVAATLRKLPVGESIGSLALIERELFADRAKRKALGQPTIATSPGTLNVVREDEAPVLGLWRKELLSVIGASAYRNWLAGTYAELVDDEIVLTAATPFFADRLTADFAPQMERAAVAAGIQASRVKVTSSKPAAGAA